jgi:hypothetical protein
MWRPSCWTLPAPQGRRPSPIEADVLPPPEPSCGVGGRPHITLRPQAPLVSRQPGGRLRRPPSSARSLSTAHRHTLRRRRLPRRRARRTPRQTAALPRRARGGISGAAPMSRAGAIVGALGAVGRGSGVASGGAGAAAGAASTGGEQAMTTSTTRALDESGALLAAACDAAASDPPITSRVNPKAMPAARLVTRTPSRVAHTPARRGRVIISRTIRHTVASPRVSRRHAICVIPPKGYAITRNV